LKAQERLTFWPGKTNAAATVMLADRWDAGSALMQAASPQGWQDLVAASALVRANQDALAACWQAAENMQKDQSGSHL